MLISHKLSDKIIKKYDIRGYFGIDLHAIDAYYLGIVLGSLSQSHPGSIYIARDQRASSPILFTHLVDGLIKAGCQKVFDLGIAPVCILYYSMYINSDAKFGICITASHNPMHDNGFKIMHQKDNVCDNKLQELAEILRQGIHLPVFSNNYKILQYDITENYLTYITQANPAVMSNKFKILFDPGGGSACNVIDKLIKIIPGDNIAINGLYDLHCISDPEKRIDNLKLQLEQKKCDIGIAFDADADRVMIVDRKGRLISNEIIAIIFAQYYKGDHKVIICDIKCSPNMISYLRNLGFEVKICRTGHPFIKEMMKKYKAAIGVERSGHFFFGDDYFGFDDGIFAALRFIAILSEYKINPEIIYDEYQAILLPFRKELRWQCEPKKQLQILNLIKQSLTVDFTEIDGIKVEQEEYWWLIRQSNTEPFLTAVIEAKDIHHIEYIADFIAKAF